MRYIKEEASDSVILRSALGEEKWKDSAEGLSLTGPIDTKELTYSGPSQGVPGSGTQE